MKTLSRALQSLNAYPSIVVRLLGKEISVRAVQPEKAATPILVRLLGKEIFLMPVQL